MREWVYAYMRKLKSICVEAYMRKCGIHYTL